MKLTVMMALISMYTAAIPLTAETGMILLPVAVITILSPVVVVMIS